MKKIGFGIIGCGVIGKVHAEQISLIKDAQLVAVADIDSKKASNLASKFGTPVYTNYHEMLKRDDIDVVNVCTPSGMHADIAIDIAKSGKHVITEKPMDVNLQKANELISVCKEYGVKLAVIFQRRFDDSTRVVKHAIDSGKFGKLLLAEAAVNWYRTQDYYDSAGWRGTWLLDGGGAFMNQAIHTVDQLQYFMGPVESVFAYNGTLGHERIEVEDLSVVVLRFKSGALGSLVATTCAYPGLSVRIELFGTKGTAVLDDADSGVLKSLYFKQQDGEESSHYGSESMNLATNASINGDGGACDPADVGGAAHRAQIEDMIQAVREDREPFVNGEEGRKALEIVLAIYQSAKTGLPVQLPLE